MKRRRRPVQARRAKTYGDVEDTLKTKRPWWMDNIEELIKPTLPRIADLEIPRLVEPITGPLSKSAKLKKATKSKAKSGAKPLAVWVDNIEPYLDQETKRNGKFPSLSSAAEAVIGFLKNSRKVCPNERTIRKWLGAHPQRRRWIRGGRNRA
jgi:hypothetical protein